MTYLAVTTTMRREEISMFFSPESEEDPFTLASSQNPFLPLKARGREQQQVRLLRLSVRRSHHLLAL